MIFFPVHPFVDPDPNCRRKSAMETTHVPAQAPKAAFSLPARCSVCGRPFLNVYPNTLPGMVFATCRCGHKTSYRTEDLNARKAV